MTIPTKPTRATYTQTLEQLDQDPDESDDSDYSEGDTHDEDSETETDKPAISARSDGCADKMDLRVMKDKPVTCENEVNSRFDKVVNMEDCFHCLRFVPCLLFWLWQPVLKSSSLQNPYAADCIGISVLAWLPKRSRTSKLLQTGTRTRNMAFHCYRYWSGLR